MSYHANDHAPDSRWAVYFTPGPETALARFGKHWFDDETYKSLTARPRLYGFHATLKAPFRLVETKSETTLSNAVSDFASDFVPVALPSLSVTLIDGFLALVPNEPCHDADALAAACTQTLDRFRAPLTDTEYQRRRPDRLSARQRGYLDQWGYPYVLEDYRWHMTLTDRIALPDAARTLRYLETLYADIMDRETVLIDSVCLVRQAHAEAHFTVAERFSLRSRDAQPQL